MEDGARLSLAVGDKSGQMPSAEGLAGFLDQVGHCP